MASPPAADAPTTTSLSEPVPQPPGLAAREAAWWVLQAVGGGAFADVALERALQRLRLAPLDRALATELAYGAIRQRGLLDAWLDAVGKVPAAQQPPRLRWLLHLGLYQLLFSDRIPAAAAVTTSVELAKRAGLQRLAPVVNGLLRAVLRRRDGLDAPAAGRAPWLGLALPADPAAALALRHSLPPWLATLLLAWLPPERAEAFARASNRPPGLDLRLNPLRSNRLALLERLANAGVAAEAIPGLASGVTLLGRGGELGRLPGYAEGEWCVQDRAAQAIAPLLAPEPGQWLLDCCAAPGGKSTHLAELIGDQGTVWAVDRSAARLERLRRNAERLGLTSINTLALDAELLPERRPAWIGRFDRILVDAPCSGLGTLARHADARWRITPEAIKGLTALQRRLLAASLPLLRPGGRLVYATCTVHPAENSELLAAFLADHPDWHLISSSQSWPGDAAGGDGFYAAVIERRS